MIEEFLGRKLPLPAYLTLIPVCQPGVPISHLLYRNSIAWRTLLVLELGPQSEVPVGLGWFQAHFAAYGFVRYGEVVVEDLLDKCVLYIDFIVILFKLVD